MTLAVSTSPSRVIRVCLTLVASFACRARAASMSSTIKMSASRARMPVGARTTSVAARTPVTPALLAAATLASTSAMISSTRPPSLFFRCSIAARPSSRVSATTASASEPSAAATAASNPAVTFMCDATKPRIPRSDEEVTDEAPSFWSSVRFRAERLAESESRSRSAW